MVAHITLKRFAEDELLQAPQLVQQTLEATLSTILKAEMALRPGERAAAAALVEQIRQLHLKLVNAFSQSVREQIVATLSGSAGAGEAAPARKGGLELQLVDDDTIVADVEVSHCADAIKSTAEFELREMETFTSAMAGDMQVAREHNPFKPLVYARALWAAALCLREEPPGLRVQFIRYAAPALAKEARKAYAAACSRLEDAGVTPAVYSTVIVPPGAKVNRQNWTLTEDALRSIAEGMPSIAAATTVAAQVVSRIPAQPAVPPGMPAGPGALPAAPAASGFMPDRTVSGLAPLAAAGQAAGVTVPGRLASADGGSYLDLLSRVMDTMVADPKLTPKSRQFISRLRPALMRLAERDLTLLDSDELAVWRFVDRIGWLPEIVPEAPHPDRLKAEQLVNSLIDHILGSRDQNGELYRWGLVRMLALEKSLFQSRRDAAAAQVMRLSAAEQKAFETGDMGGEGHESGLMQLDTVPADLVDLQTGPQPLSADPTPWLENLKEGDHALLFIQGRWVSAMLLWHGPMREMWLWADCRSETTWPVRRSALAKLHTARLATPHEPRSLAKLAARAISHQIARSRRG